LHIADPSHKMNECSAWYGVCYVRSLQLGMQLPKKGFPYFYSRELFSQRSGSAGWHGEMF
jgi:hypothetical protein